MWRYASALLAAVGTVAVSAAYPAEADPIPCHLGATVDSGLSGPQAQAAPIGYRGGGGQFSALITWDAVQGATCYVIERFIGGHTPNDEDFKAIAILASDGDSAFTDHGPYSSGGLAWYRLYAAHESGRSAYSEITYAQFPFVDPPPSQTSSPLTPRGDLNCDGEVTIVDVIPLLKDQAGLDPELPDDCPSLSTPTAYAAVLALPLGLGMVALVYVRRRRSLIDR